MNEPSPLSELVRAVFVPTQRGVVGLVNDLLKICQDRGLQLDWQDGRCRVRSTGVPPEETIELPLAKSVFRALLARLATLCDERNPGSVSPYGGAGELTFGADPVITCAVAFTNTPDEQRVELTPIATNEDQGPPGGPGGKAWQDLSAGNDHRGSIALAR